MEGNLSKIQLWNEGDGDHMLNEADEEFWCSRDKKMYSIVRKKMKKIIFLW